MGLEDPRRVPWGDPPKATVQVSKQSDEAVTARSGPDSCHSRRPAPPPCVCPPSSPESPADVSHQSQPQTPLQTPERGGPPTGAHALRGPPPAPQESRTRAQQLSHPQSGPGKRCAPGGLQRCLPAGGFAPDTAVQPPPAPIPACALLPSERSANHRIWGEGRVVLRFLPAYCDSSSGWFILEKPPKLLF